MTSMVERVTQAIRENIKVDASGLYPAVVSHFIFGFEEAARAAIEAMRTATPEMVAAYDAEGEGVFCALSYDAMISASLLPPQSEE